MAYRTLDSKMYEMRGMFSSILLIGNDETYMST